jgi:hypothetical protein
MIDKEQNIKYKNKNIIAETRYPPKAKTKTKKV